jgi:acyl carrier protein
MLLTEQELKLAQFFIEREGEGVLEIIKSIDFMEQGLLDSLDMVTLAVFVQKEFGRKLDLTDPRIMRSMSRFDSLYQLACG